MDDVAVDVIGPETAVRTRLWVWRKERLARVKVFELGKVSCDGEHEVDAKAYVFH